MTDQPERPMKHYAAIWPLPPEPYPDVHPTAAALELVAHIAVNGIEPTRMRTTPPTHIDVHNAIAEVAGLDRTPIQPTTTRTSLTHDDAHADEQAAVLAANPHHHAGPPPSWIDDHTAHTVWMCRVLTPATMWAS